MIACPVCGRRLVGKVGAGQYYCWECCVEFSVNGPDIKIFSVEMDGTLTDAVLGQNTATIQLQKG
jgi:hypothetical protein